jgi:hypothetical protein
LLRVLSDNKDAIVEMPSDDRVKELCKIFHERHDLLPDVYCVADGLKLYFEQCAFVFSIDGRIIRGIVNAPGSLHDSTLAEWGGIYESLEEVYLRTDAKCCVDSAFASTNNAYLLKSSQNYMNANGPLSMLRMEQATSL